MFKLAAVRSVWWLVTVQIPQDGGKTQAAEFEAELEILSQEVHDELVNAGGDLLERTLLGWKRVRDESGKDEIPFSPETKTAMLAISYVRVALLKAYYEAFQGRKAARKNS